ncbi:MAG: protein translocase subunit SecF [Dehalococcoidia bacterium]
MIDFAGHRWIALTISFVIFLIAAAALAIWQLKPGIEFTSGSSFTLEFTEQTVEQAALRSALADLGHEEARVQGASDNSFLIRTRELQGAPPVTSPTTAGPVETSQGEIDTLQNALCQRFGVVGADGTCTGVNRKDYSTVSEAVSKEIAWKATAAVLAASVAILFYVTIAFRRLPKPFLYGSAAIVAVLHDAFIVLGLFAVLGEFDNREVDTAFITAILTVIGFSVHDTIVVFDRIRERLLADPYVPLAEAVNASMTETLARSINTSLVVVLTVVAMLLLGGESIQNFLIVLLVGIVSGTYSSIAVASQLVVSWESGDFGRFFRRLFGRKPADAVAAPAA